MAIFACSQRCAFATTIPYVLADQLILESIADSIIPGAVLCVVENGDISYLQAYGNRAIL